MAIASPHWLSPRLRFYLGRTAVSVWLIATAFALRYWPLQDLGDTIPYLTFYPAVMIAALYGGLYGGTLSTTLSALTVFFWQSATNPVFLSQNIG